MRVARIAVSNFMRLSAVEVVPNGAVVHITGANGAGKSSFLMAFVCALGGKEVIPADPVRHGAEFAQIVADLQDLIITLRIYPDRTTKLVVTNAEGFEARSPQKLLNALFGKLLDPVAFSKLKPKEQRELLADMLGMSEMLDTLWRADESDREKRKEVNRDLKAIIARIDAMEAVEPVDPVDVKAVFVELSAARDHNTQIAKAQRARTDREQQALTLRTDAERHRAEAARLLDRADAAEADAERIISELANAPAIAEAIDTDAIEQRIANAEAINAQHRAFTEREKLIEQATELEAMSNAYTASLEQREAERKAVIEAAELPIAGLGFGDDHLTYNGVRLDQASTGEQLRISAAIAMAMSPKLRVMIVREGSLLDENSERLLTEMAEAQDFLCIIESVETPVVNAEGVKTFPGGIYIEEGEVVSIDGVPVEVAA